MPVCFCMREFAIITGLNCHLPIVYDEEKMSTKTLRRRQQIIDLVGKSCKEKELIEHIKSKDVRKSVLLSADRDAFSAHPWRRVSYDLTTEYLLKTVNPNVKTSNLYGFPWAFMCWAFEAIPSL
ncbi:hypothetical protein P3L10_018660 [Capsicum annuum]